MALCHKSKKHNEFRNIFFLKGFRGSKTFAVRRTPVRFGCPLAAESGHRSARFSWARTHANRTASNSELQGVPTLRSHSICRRRYFFRHVRRTRRCVDLTCTTCADCQCVFRDTSKRNSRLSRKCRRNSFGRFDRLYAVGREPSQRGDIICTGVSRTHHFSTTVCRETRRFPP